MGDKTLLPLCGPGCLMADTDALHIYMFSFSVCKTAEGGDAAASLTGSNAADEDSDKSFGEM